MAGMHTEEEMAEASDFDKIFKIETRDRPGLLLAVMDVLATGESRISFEGNLLHSELVNIEGIGYEEDDVLKRATLQPKLDFLILPLRKENLAVIKKAIISKIAFGGSRGIVHVQIKSSGKIAFAAYDNFDRECVFAYSGISSALLDELIKTGILRSYQCMRQSK